MTEKNKKHDQATGASPDLKKTIVNDLLRGDLKRNLCRDLADIYQFYLDDDTRARLKKMRRFKRWLFSALWLLKSLVLKLTPLRRIMLLLAIVCLFLSRNQGAGKDIQSASNLGWLGFVILLLILMLELKDKLLAQDELEAGRKVQSALMPERNPKVPGWDLWLFTRPANEVGGDLVDYLKIGDNRWGVALGDVAGKGLGAALFMARLQATLRALVPTARSLAELGSQMNTIFCRDGLPTRFVSLVFLEFKSGSGQVRMLNAGHMPPIRLQNSILTEMPQGAPALGIHSRANYQEQQIDLEPGSLLLVYSDGLTEAQNALGEFFGEKNVFNLLPKLIGLSAEQVGVQLLANLKNFVGEARPSDDLSLVVLKRLA